MLRVAVCDDEELICRQVEHVVLQYAETQQLHTTVEVFNSGESFLQALQDETVFDLIFLDIELQQINGIEVGQYIRNTLENDLLQIIYISGKEQYALSLFQLRPFQFLIKPIQQEAIIHCLQEYCRIYAQQQTYFEFLSGKTVCKVAVTDIMYLESQGRTIRLHTPHDEKPFYGKLDLLAKEPFAASMLRIHKSYLVNPLYVIGFYSDSVRMQDGKSLAISRSHQKAVKQALLSGHSFT